MAFHGGMLGTIIAMWLFARRHNVTPSTVMDVVAASVPFGLFFGRIANFINAEVVGRESDVPWAMVFPGWGPLPRHPSQLYEAALEGVALFLILRWLTHRRLALQRQAWSAALSWPAMPSFASFASSSSIDEYRAASASSVLTRACCTRCRCWPFGGWLIAARPGKRAPA